MDHLQSDLSGSAMATRFSLDEGVLLSAFQTHVGITLDQFVLRRRIERALDLLKHTSATENEIALGIGLKTASTFRSAFFNYLGVSPTDYRKILPVKYEPFESCRTKASLQICECKLDIGRVKLEADLIVYIAERRVLNLSRR